MTSGVFLNCSPSCMLRQSLFNPELTDSAGIFSLLGARVGDGHSHGSWASNICTASSFPTEPPPQPLRFFFFLLQFYPISWE